MKHRLKKLLPTRESLHNNRWLRWLGPALHHPRLWHMSRKGIALGLALGIFFGLLIPVAQIPVSATLAVILRANLPVAVASTLVTNPVTFGPVYYGAYKLGRAVLFEPEADRKDVESVLAVSMPEGEPAEDLSVWGRVVNAWHQLGEVGKPLIVGLAIIATLTGVSAYFLVSLLWALKVRWSRKRRLKQRQSP
ncbi:DUF2062 domain-containing protein [Hydrogenophaga aquatica]